MEIMKTTFVLLLVGLGVFLVLLLGGGILVLGAFGLGYLLNMLLGFDPFQATLIALLGVLFFGILAERWWQIVKTPLPPTDFNADDFGDEFDDDEFDDDEWDDDEWDDEEDDEDKPPVIYPGIPRWRQPIKSPDFTNVQPDERCPCGSGRKFKNCHGAKRSRN